MTEARDADVLATESAACDAPSARDGLPEGRLPDAASLEGLSSEATPAGIARDDAGTPEAAAEGEPTPATDVFARRRMELGMSLEDVANQLKFSARQIQALETGDFERLPGGAFARGMMRSYARLLKLEPAEIGAQLLAVGANPRLAPEEAVSLRAPIPFSEGGKHVNLVYMILSFVILAVVAFFAIQWYQESGSSGKLAFVRPLATVAVAGNAAAPLSTAVPSPFATSSDTPVAPQATTPASAGASPPADARPATEENRTATPAKAQSASASVSNTSAAAPATEADRPPTAATSSGPGTRKILLRFESESWVRIKAAKGAILLSQLNPGGTEKIVEGDPPFELTIGNAPRVRLFYNDKPVDLKPYFNVDVARLTLN